MRYLIKSFLFAIFLVATITAYGFQTPKKNMNPPFDFEQAWKEIDSLKRIHQLENVDSLLTIVRDKAVEEKADDHYLKFVNYKLNYNQQKIERASQVNKEFLETELSLASYPNDLIIHSMLGAFYKQFAAENYWKLSQATPVNDSIKSTDIYKWDMKEVLEAAFEHFDLSVQNLNTQAIPIKKYEALLNNYKENGELYRPTLYDLLGHRALDFFMNEANYITRPAERFEINQMVAFDPVFDFVNATFKEVEKLSYKYKALVLFQDMLRFHQLDIRPEALVDLDLKRLQFVKNNSTLSNKEDLYVDALDLLRKKYNDHEVYSEISAHIGYSFYQKGGSYHPFTHPDNKWDWKYAFERYEEGITKYPDSYGAKLCQARQSTLMYKTLNVGMEKIVIPERSILAYLEFRNVPHVYMKVVLAKDNDNELRNNLGARKFAEILAKRDALQHTEFDVPDDGDLHQHRTEFKIKGLPAGEYYVLVSDNEYFAYEYQAVNVTKIQVTSLAYFAKKRNNGAHDVYVVDRETGQPQKNVTVEFWQRKYNSTLRKYQTKMLEKATTDGNGHVALSKPLHESYWLKLIKKDEIFENKSTLYDSRKYEDKPYETVQFFLDRKIYRPGQTVYFKTILLSKDEKKMPSIIPDRKVDITFYDANGQKVETKSFTSNEYGTINGSFQAPTSGLTGNMSLRANIGSYYGSSVNFRVEEYKRPKFEVAFNPVEGSYALNDEVTVSGNAKAFAGNMVDGAKVNYRVVRETSYPYWRWWLWGSYPSTPSVEITNGETTTNENGIFEIKFQALPDVHADETKSPLFYYRVYADVIDITGETHSTSTSISAGYIALQADISVPSSVQKDKLKSFHISTTNLNGNFEPAKGTIAVYPLKTPHTVFRKRLWSRPDVHMLTKEDYANHFSGIPYADENEYKNWEKGAVLLNENFDTEASKKLSFEEVDLSGWKSGYYQVVLNTHDKYGKSIEIIKYFQLVDMEKPIQPNLTHWKHQPSKSFEPGEVASLYYGTAYNRIWVLYESYDKDGNPTESKWVGIKTFQKFNIPIKETDRGNVAASFTFVAQNRGYQDAMTVSVPWSNKQLKVEYQTFRNKLLPGQEEEWRIKISGSKKEKVAAEMVAAMYDASLDQFASNSWYMNLFPTFSPNNYAGFYSNFEQTYGQLIAKDWQPNFGSPSRYYPYLNLKIPNSYSYYGLRSRSSEPMLMAMEESSAEIVTDSAVFEEEEEMDGIEDDLANKQLNAGSASLPSQKEIFGGDDIDTRPQGNVDLTFGNDFKKVKVRTNLNETVFFYPDLQTDANGDVIISFTMNEALTRWKFMLLAHTKDLATVSSTQTVVTQKDLMVQPNPPRFFRENDIIQLTAKVSNLSDRDLSGTAKIELFDALTMKPINEQLGLTNDELSFEAKKGQSAPLAWELKLPDNGLSAITYRVIAIAENFSDGEENTKPVLTNRMLLTETMPMSVRGETTKTFNFKAMSKISESQTLKNHQATLEFTSNPAWYAVQALPYLMEYPYECTEQVFSRFYANSLAASVTNSHPKIKTIFDQWKSKDLVALESNLSKNQELKYALLEETPWVFSSQNEAQRKRDIALLFDLNKMENELNAASKKIADRQLSNGGFAWFPGGRDSWYITQYLVEGMGHLKYLGVNKTLSGVQSIQDMDDVTSKAVKYTDDRMIERYNDLAEYIKEHENVKWEDDHLSYMDIHYLYARSFYPEISLSKKAQEVHDYFLGQAKKYWMKRSMYMQGMMSLVLYRNEETATSDMIIEGLRQTAIVDEEMGMYWKYPTGYYWYQMPIETHSLMIEVFSEAGRDDKSVEELKLWLLKNKQTTHWKTTKATSSAVYALLMNGDNWLLEDQEIDITLGANQLDQSKIDKEAGTGHFKVKWDADEITADMAKITIKNPNKSPAWGAMYWQYFEDLDNVKIFKDTPLKLNKQLYIEKNTADGPVLEPITAQTPITVGDKVKVRIELQVDRDMEYVHMKDMRASGFEPINVMSHYKWQGGLGYYESTKDAATNFFFSYLPKGDYVFEYPLRATFEGDFSNGVTTIQCMYAPEFTSHSEGIRVKIEK